MKDTSINAFFGFLCVFLVALGYFLFESYEIERERLELDKKELEFRLDEASFNKAVVYDRLDEYRAMYFEHNKSKK